MPGSWNDRVINDDLDFVATDSLDNFDSSFFMGDIDDRYISNFMLNEHSIKMMEDKIASDILTQKNNNLNENDIKTETGKMDFMWTTFNDSIYDSLNSKDAVLDFLMNNTLPIGSSCDKNEHNNHVISTVMTDNAPSITLYKNAFRDDDDNYYGDCATTSTCTNSDTSSSTIPTNIVTRGKNINNYNTQRQYRKNRPLTPQSINSIETSENSACEDDDSTSCMMMMMPCQQIENKYIDGE